MKECNSALSLLNKASEKHQVSVKLPGSDEEQILVLIETSAETSMYEDFANTFEGSLEGVALEMAKKYWGESNITMNAYGVLCDADMKPVFAFNRQFADYNPETKLVEYHDPEEILVNMVQPQSGETAEVKPAPPQRRQRRSGGGGGMGQVYKYAAFGGGDKEGSAAGE